MKELDTLELFEVFMPARGWKEFMNSLFSMQRKVHAILSRTDVDDDTTRFVQNSPGFKVYRLGWYSYLEFSTIARRASTISLKDQIQDLGVDTRTYV